MPTQNHIFYAPPLPFMGGRQPHEGRKLSPALIPAAVTPDDPPFVYQGRRRQQMADIAVSWLPKPPVPQAQRRLLVQASTPDTPPGTHGTPVWVMVDDGRNRWSYPRQLNPALIPAAPTPDDPPWVSEGRRRETQYDILVSWPQPNWPSQRTRKGVPPAPPTPDNPPFAMQGRRRQQIADIGVSWLPPPWPSQRTRKTIPPAPPAPDNPPFRAQGRRQQQYTVGISWLPKPPHPRPPRPNPPEPPPTPPFGSGSRSRRRLFRRGAR